MLTRVMETQASLKLTRENHPENAPQAEKRPTVSLFAMIAFSALSGVVGMTLGTAALSTALQSDGPWEVVCLLPLVVTLVCFLTGWMGAFFWMCREESSKGESSQS